MSGPDASAAALKTPPRRQPLSAIAESLSSSTRLPFLDSVWLSRFLTILQTFAVPFVLWFKPLVVLFAISWLFYRAYQVLNKPLEELAGVLGFDIPSAPVIDLASIKADGAIVRWSLPEKQKPKSTFKFEINLNGAPIQTLSIHETAATITGLQPGCYYVVRVSLINNVDFSSRSDPVRFRTRPASSGDFFIIGPDGHDTDHDATREPVPRARPFRGLKDIAPASPDTPPLLRENSTSLAPRRSIRRSSHAVTNTDRHEPSTEEGESSEGADTIQQLTAKLDAIRRDTEEAEKLARDDDEDETRQKGELTRERDELRAEATEKERASRNLKKEVSALERQNTAAQNERTKQERFLQQKKQERQKLQDDMVRWEREAGEMRNSLGDIQTRKDEHLRGAETRKDQLRTRQADEGTAIKALEEEVKDKIAEIRRLERAIRNSSPSGMEPETNLVQQFQHDAEEQRRWDVVHTHLNTLYGTTATNLERARRMYSEQVAYVENIRQRRLQEDAANRFTSSPPSTDRMPHRGDSQRSRRAQSGQSSSDSPRLANFPISSGVFGPSMTSTTSMFSSAPFLNIHNGMTLPANDMDMSDEDRERMTGGALMSPGAGAELLPADLFGEGEGKISPEFVPPLPGLGSLPGLPGIPGPVFPPTQEIPASPASGSSRSPSVFVSPQASQQNLHISSPENKLDADRRSIHSTRSNRATSGGGAGSRFSGMFGIKHRKTPVEDDVLSLGKTQSHSMPRQDQGIPGLDSATRKRNSSISGTNFAFGGDGGYDAPPQTAPASRRSRAFGLFSRKDDGWPSSFTSGLHRRPSSPRPGSTHSSELPRPSADSSRWGVDGWPSNDAASGARSSPLAFGAGWNAPSGPQSRLYGSRLPSRRPSQQYGNTGPVEDILEDDNSDDMDPYTAPPQFGAIGTRPPSGSKKSDKTAVLDQPKLNPNAKDFKSFFSSRKSKTRDGTSSAQGSAAGTPNVEKFEFEESPPNSRKSKDTRDARSMTTTESSIAESGRASTDLARTPSYSTSDAPAPSPLLGGSSLGKESFMAKLTRKSSSSKFSLPYLKREKSKLDTNSTPPTSAADEEEASMSASVGSLHNRESKEVQRKGWSNVLKLGGGSSKKKGNETPSLSGLSLASTEDGEVEEEG